MPLSFEYISLHNLPEHNIILGQSHFIKTVEDLHELMVNCVPQARFGLAFCEASATKLIRHSGTDKDLTAEATRMIKAVGAGHSFIIVMKDIYPINILPRLHQVPEIVTIFCATANPVQVVVAQTELGRGIMGVIDGYSPLGTETDIDITKRHHFLRTIGYKQ